MDQHLWSTLDLGVDAGVPTRDVQEALRHRDQRTTATYLHTSDAEKTRAISLLPSRQ
jgi:integrase